MVNLFAMEILNTTPTVLKEQVPTVTGHKNSIESTVNFLEAIKSYISTFNGDPNHSKNNKCRLLKPSLPRGVNAWFCAREKEYNNDGGFGTIENFYELIMKQFYKKQYPKCTFLKLKKTRLEGSLNENDIKFRNLQSITGQAHELDYEKKIRKLDYINYYRDAVMIQSHGTSPDPDPRYSANPVGIKLYKFFVEHQHQKEDKLEVDLEMKYFTIDKDSLFCIKGRLCIPASATLCPNFLCMDMAFRHLRVAKTLATLYNFYWLSVHKDTEDFPDRKLGLILLFPTTKDSTALDTAEELYLHWYKDFGLPASIVSDRDCRLLGNMRGEFLTWSKIGQQMAATCHPKSDLAENALKAVSPPPSATSSYAHLTTPTGADCFLASISSWTQQTAPPLDSSQTPHGVSINHGHRILATSNSLPLTLSTTTSSATGTCSMSANWSSSTQPTSAVPLSYPAKFTERFPGPYKITHFLPHSVYCLKLLFNSRRPILDQITDYNQPHVYHIEAIIDEQTVRNLHQYMVKWQGYPSSHFQWDQTCNLNAADLIALYHGSQPPITPPSSPPSPLAPRRRGAEAREIRGNTGMLPTLVFQGDAIAQLVLRPCPAHTQSEA
ncbi:hypothetical protein BDK51DRAFT_44854 [Blyttiomyces helicus]|uniref:Chromo domain-containing protein n=1 Tax=Blyttiomyces helicus TaxID=388810 RepID=A0A4P9WAA8_9FUNG|nr:hypothetical protein BDK51DRAFT_44854 [Blyttiomyces helicus]|eukprot:RKO89364.1 hypothetical protein BDK51DRAFT_44854 [Blyttiomyces helicus]